MARISWRQRLAALRGGKRWWPAEVVLRTAGLLSLILAARVILAEHRLAITPALHDPTPVDLGLCALFVGLLSLGLSLSFWGPVLFRQISLPGHF